MTNSRGSRRSRRERRGVGAIIGGIILATILITSVLIYYISILSADKVKESYDILAAQASQDKAAEKLEAAVTELVSDPPSYPAGKYFNTEIKNEGSLPLVVSYSSLTCIDCASPNNPSLDGSKVTLNSKETATRFVGLVSVDKTYRVDFITERGNIFSTEDCLVGVSEISCSEGTGSSTPNFALDANPNPVFINPGSSGEATVTVTPEGGFASDVDLSYSAAAGITAAFAPGTVTGGSGSSTLTINVDNSVTDGTYVLTVTGGSTGSPSITHTTDVTVVVFTATGGEEPKLDDAILKPQIQGIFPNPHGSLNSASSKQGLWGVVVANPSDSTMTVRRVVVTAFNPYGTNPAIFPNSCPVTNVLPASGGSWACPSQNTLIWSGTVTIPAHTAQSFLATAGKPTSNDNFPSYSINFNVFTTFGQYAKAGYSGSMTKATSEIANVYLSTVKDSAATTSMIGTRTVASGANLHYFATIANLGDSGTQINAGTKLIITIPAAFKNVNVLPNPPSAGFGPCTWIDLGDGSTQITCPLATNLLSGQARSVDFTMDAPVNDTPNNKLYPLLVLADGTDGNPAPMGAVGPVAENVIIVQPA